MLAVSPINDFEPLVFGAELVRLRLDAHLSQRALAKLSGVSNTAISDLESGEAPPPHPLMLSKLARGLATSGLGVRDEQRAEANYLTLMRAAGYVSDQAAHVTLLDMRSTLMARGFRPDEAHVVDQILADMTSRALNERQRDEVLRAVTAILAAHKAGHPDR